MSTKLDQYFKDTQENGLYHELAELYDFIYKRHYNYDRQLELVRKYTDEETSNILEGACGPGRLSKRLSDHYTNIVAFDLNNGVLDVAKSNSENVDFRQDNMLDLDITESFDAYVVLGNALVHLTGDGDFTQFANESEHVIEENGKLIFDYMPAENMINGYSGSDTFESQRYRVDRDIITTRDSNQLYTMSFSFEITDKKTGETTVTGDSVKARVYTDQEVKNTLRNAGFSDIRIKDYSDNGGAEVKDRVAIATK